MNQSDSWIKVCSHQHKRFAQKFGPIFHIWFVCKLKYSGYPGTQSSTTLFLIHLSQSRKSNISFVFSVSAMVFINWHSDILLRAVYILGLRIMYFYGNPTNATIRSQMNLQRSGGMVVKWHKSELPENSNSHNYYKNVNKYFIFIFFRSRNLIIMTWCECTYSSALVM